MDPLSSTYFKEDVKFEEFGDFAQKTGGFITFIMKIFGLAGTWFMAMSLRKIVQNIQENQEAAEQEPVETITVKLKDRLSFNSLYKLFDQVKAIVNRLTLVESHLDQEVENLRAENDQL